MNNKFLTSTNVSFQFLQNSSDFLNIVLNNISCSVLLLDKNMELQAFNDPLKTMFMNKADEDLLYIRCGEAIGCAYTIDEMRQCGKTSKCKYCELRVKAMEAYVERKSIHRQYLSREFYRKTGEKEQKHLQFSILPFSYKTEYYLIVLVEDITSVISLQNQVSKN